MRVILTDIQAPQPPSAALPVSPLNTGGDGRRLRGHSLRGPFPMKLKLAVSLTMLTALLVGGAFSTPPARSANQINWYSYQDGMAEARQSGKSMVVYFYADWCTYCVRMQKETFGHDSVIEFMNNKVIAVKVDVDAEKKVARAFGVRGLPATVMLTRNGDQVGPMPGFIPPKSYLAMLTKIMEQS
jgi:thioredoxin-related protein